MSFRQTIRPTASGHPAYGTVLHCLLFGQISPVLSKSCLRRVIKLLEGRIMKLFDLSGEEDDRKISPYCWRTRLALAHKKLGFASVPWRAEEKDAIAFSGQGQVSTPP